MTPEVATFGAIMLLVAVAAGLSALIGGLAQNTPIAVGFGLVSVASAIIVLACCIGELKP